MADTDEERIAGLQYLLDENSPALRDSEYDALRWLLADWRRLKDVMRMARAYIDAPGQVRGEVYRELCAAVDAAIAKEQADGKA